MSKTKSSIFPLVLLILLAFIVVITIFGYAYFNNQLQPVSSNSESTSFIVNKGQSIDGIGQALAAAHLIRSPLIFKLVIVQNNLGKKIQAGTFKLSGSMSTPEIAQNLTHGIEQGVTVTLLEGWRREEFATALKQAYLSKGLPFDSNQFLTLTKDKEGYLYPDTYEFPLNASESAIVDRLTATFNDHVTVGLAQAIKDSHKSLTDVIILASLVEREARSDTARQMVAGILNNRLTAGWPLQIDATVQYVIGYDKADQTWWKPPLALDTKIQSPYNTYLNPGLPPGPICSPSLSSINAVLNPTPSDYWFYLTGNDNQMHYAKTVSEHNQNIAKYLK
jgi:UPF0755 protein